MNVEYIIDIIGITRGHFLKLIESCNLDQLNKIPPGFANNLIWNFGHVMSSQQSLCYERSGITPRIDLELIDPYRPQTFPETFVGESRLQQIKESVIQSVEMLREDYKDGVFKTYDERQTKYGVLITNIEEAIAYISTHETLHFGYAKSLLKVL